MPVRDLGARKDLGTMTSYSADLPDPRVGPAQDHPRLKITPTEGPVRYDSTVPGWSLGAVFDNETAGCSGRGYATNLDQTDATESFAVTGGGTGGTHRPAPLRHRQQSQRRTVGDRHLRHHGRPDSPRPTQPPGTNGAWRTASVRVDLLKGRNFLKVVGIGANAPVHLDYITIEGGPSPKITR